MQRPKYCSLLDCDFGNFQILSSDKGITQIRIAEQPMDEFESHHSFLCRKELLDYFDGRLQKFTVNLDLQHASDFHRTVWNSLIDIPYGTTTSYLQLAKNLNNEKAIRAVGRANALNPIPFVIPCHRVIGSDGSLTGYALGLDLKRRLLNLENPIKFPLQKSLF